MKIEPLDDLSNLTNEQSAVAVLNNNNEKIEGAFENTLSRDGSTPNQMEANLDMNSNRILNLPSPISATEPVRLTDVANPVDINIIDNSFIVSPFMETVLDDANASAAQTTLGVPAPFSPTVHPARGGFGFPPDHRLLWSDQNQCIHADVTEFVSTDPTRDPRKLTIGGTPTVGDQVRIHISGAFTGSPKLISYTVQSGDTLEDIAGGLWAIIEGDPQLIDEVTPSGIFLGSTGPGLEQGPTSIAFSYSGLLALTITGSVIGAGTETFDIQAEPQKIEQGPTIKMSRFISGRSPLAGDKLANITFEGQTSAVPEGISATYAQFLARIHDPAGPDGECHIAVQVDGTLPEALSVTPIGVGIHQQTPESQFHATFDGRFSGSAVARFDGLGVRSGWDTDDTVNAGEFINESTGGNSKTALKVHAGTGAQFEVLAEHGAQRVNVTALQGELKLKTNNTAKNIVLDVGDNGDNFRITNTGIFAPVIGSGSGTALHILTGGGNNQIVIQTSSKQYKKDIKPLELEAARNIVLNSEPVVYKDATGTQDENWVGHGFIAEDIAEIDPAYVGFDSEKKPISVNYAQYVVPLVKMVQDLTKRVEELEKRLNA